MLGWLGTTSPEARALGWQQNWEGLQPDPRAAAVAALLHGPPAASWLAFERANRRGWCSWTH